MMTWLMALYFASFFLLAFAIIFKRSGLKKFFGKQTEKYIKFTKDEEAEEVSLRQLLGRLVDVVMPLIAGKAVTEKLQALIDKTGMPLRASEFIFFQAAGIVVATFFGYMLAGPAGALLLFIIGIIGPIFGLKHKEKQRDSKFHEQLPDTLSLIAGALKAGYSFLQAVDMTVKETGPPTSTEFNRVLTEARLGLPIEQALDNMAQRMESDSFDWTVMAVKIQREVGGNLAEILEILAETIRERDRVGRQIKVLTAEGRLSALILFLLPFAVSAMLWVVNPGYLSTLFTHPMGLAMLAFAALMLSVGGVWLKKVVNIEV